MYKECGNNFCLVGHGKLAGALRGSRAKSEEILEGYPDFASSTAGMMEYLRNKMITVKGSPQASAHARLRTHAATKDGESSLRWVGVGVQINPILQRPVLTTPFPPWFLSPPKFSILSSYFCLSSRPNLFEVPHYLYLGQQEREASTGESNIFAP